MALLQPKRPIFYGLVIPLSLALTRRPGHPHANFYAKRYGILDVQNTALGHSGKTLYEWGYFYIDTEWAQHASADLIVLRWGINDPMVGPYTLAQCKDALDRGLSKLRANKTVSQ
ncbi:hypothetical protein CWR41_02735 [Cedecea lapagei]|nr:hypothetical protein CWR41_02735 [Cedecea lapagei]